MKKQTKKRGRPKVFPGGCSLHLLYMPHEMSRRIRTESEATGRSQSEVIRRAVDKVYEKVEDEKKNPA